MLEIPCAHLDVAQEACRLGRQFPRECKEGCAAYQPVATDDERQPCEIWNRVMGYHRPVSAWNAGKQQEHKDRRLFRERKVSFLEGEGHD